MGFFALFNTFALRSCLSIAITKMVVPLNISIDIFNQTCSSYENNSLSVNKEIDVSSGTFTWSERTQVFKTICCYLDKCISLYDIFEIL